MEEGRVARVRREDGVVVGEDVAHGPAELRGDGGEVLVRLADAALEDLEVAGAPGRGRPRPRAVVRGAAAPVDLRAGPVERREGAAGRERRVVDELGEARAGPRAPLDAPERGAVERRDLGRDFAWAGKG